MAFDCTDGDHKDLAGFLGIILDAHTSKKISKDRAVIIIGHVILAAVKDNSVEFRTLIRIPLEPYALDTRRPNPANDAIKVSSSSAVIE